MPKQERRRRFLSVGTKLAVATVAVMATASFLLFRELTERERRRLVDAKAVAGSMVTELFAASCAAPLVFADDDAVAVELEKLRSNGAIVYAAVYSSKEDKTVRELNPEKRPSYDFKHGKTASRLLEYADRIELVKDIRDTRGKVVGFAALNFSLADENAAFRVSRRRLLWFAFLIAGGTAGLLIMLTRRVIVAPLARVTEAARRLEQGDLHARADVKSSDEVGNLALVFNSMGDAIVDREQKLVQARKNLQDLFDNMLQAIFTVGPDGRIDAEVSAYAKQIFGDVPIAGQSVVEFLRLESMAEKEVVSRMKFWLQHIFGADDFQWELSEPERIRGLNYTRTNADGVADERVLELDYAPLYKDGEIVKIMFLVKDVTEVHRLQAEIARREEQNKENLARIRQIAAMEPDLFNTFIAEAKIVLDGCEEALADLEEPSRRQAAVNSLFRGMHTLKGNARMFKLTAVQDIAHATEDYFQRVRDGEVGLGPEIGLAMHERIADVRKLLGEFEKLGRQVLGGEQESPGEAALSFLRAQERPFDDGQSDLASLGDPDGDKPARARLVARATQLRAEAQGHGFVNVTAAFDSVLQVLGRAETTALDLVPCLHEVNQALQLTRSLSAEVATAELWPYFRDEARATLRALAAKLSAGGDRAREALDVFLLAAGARSFGLATLANVASDYHRAMTEDGVDGRTVLNALESWVVDGHNLVEMRSKPEADVDVLGRFHGEAEDLVERLNGASASQVPLLLLAAIACARRYRFRVAQAVLESLAQTGPKDGGVVAEALRREVLAYEAIRREMRDNEAAEHLLLVPPGEDDERELANWWEAAGQAGLNTLLARARSLAEPARRHLLDDVRHFRVLMPAMRGAKTGQPIQRVLEGRIAALRDALRGLRQAVAHVREDRQAILPPLNDLEKAVVHLTTSSLGDVLAPVASTAADLARERGKPLEEVSLENLDFFLEARAMQKVRGAVMHAVRNAVDHGLETADARVSSGKAPRGRISISARERDGWIDLTVEDDGRGVDTARVKQVALKRGLITAEQAAALSTEEAHELLFLPGFSTAATVSSVSGRGVGMDAIRAIARDLGGDARLASAPGRGSRLTMHFPVRFAAESVRPGKVALGSSAHLPN